MHEYTFIYLHIKTLTHTHKYIYTYTYRYMTCKYTKAAMPAAFFCQIAFAAAGQ
jgi:hypothetical protein